VAGSHCRSGQTHGERRIPPELDGQEVTMPLTPQQQRFIQEYLVDLNGTEAYQRAGYKATPRAARANAARLLANASVQAAIADAQAARAQRVHLTQDAVLQELVLLASSDITHYGFDQNGDVVLRPGAPEGALRAISSLKRRLTVTEDSTTVETTITLWPKPPALRMCGEHLSLFAGTEHAPPDIHVHVHSAHARLLETLNHHGARLTEDRRNGH
jgi:phage terminase small subunit